MSKWLDDAIFYEVYPQSFCDSNADGIGDFAGLISKLDYIESLGCNAIWMNPCFDSPFVDAGYDVRNYYLAAERYGTNEDLKKLFIELHRRGMHILLDLVPGHTSVECEWFKQSQRHEKNMYTDRYIWSDSVWEGFDGISGVIGAIRGGTERLGTCATNFFNAQPALNYGFARVDPEKKWQQSVDDDGPKATIEEMKNVMRFWLSMGWDGFRVDMAHSLVKNDDDHVMTIKLWRGIREFLDEEYPEAAMVSEWGEPEKSLVAGFKMDFLLHFGPSHYLELFREDKPYFSKKGEGDASLFFEKYVENLAKTKELGGMMCIPSGNHDMIRMAKTLDMDEMKIAFGFIMTMPGVPFIYYGDEIGMKYVEGLASVEGGYERTGSRSPMAFDSTPNAGFSSAPMEKLYIAQDESKSYINVQSEEQDKDSLLNQVKSLIAFRKANHALSNRADFELLYCKKDTYPIAYKRSDENKAFIIVINPGEKEVPLPDELVTYSRKWKEVYHIGEAADDVLKTPGGSFFIYEIS